MSFTYLGFNEKKALEMELDSIIEILRYLFNFIRIVVMLKREIEDHFVYWMQYEKSLENVPILEIKSKDTLRRILKKLCNTKVLIFRLLKSREIYTFYEIGKRYKNLFFIINRWKKMIKQHIGRIMPKSSRLKSTTVSAHMRNPVLLKSSTKILIY